MTPIYSSAALKTHQREVKDAARSSVVHITENGNAAFVLMSEDLYEANLRKAAEEAAYAERLRACIAEGRADVREGRYVEGTEAFFGLLERRAAHHG